MCPDTTTNDRLQGLLEVTRLVRDESDHPTLLQAIARAIATSMGFRTVVVNLYRPAWNDFEVTTVHGSEQAQEALLGDTLDWAAWEPLLDDRFERRGAYLIPHGAFDWEADVGRRYVPDWQPSPDPGAWHPDDELFVPMRRPDGHLLGILSVGEPVSGRRPNDDELEVLVALADHLALALASAQEDAAAARYRGALRQLLQISSQMTETLSVESILQAICDGISQALGFRKVCIDLPDPDTRVFTTRAATGWTLSDMAQNAPITMWELAPLLDPPFARAGCFLLSEPEAQARLPKGHHAYESVMNGRGPMAWERHWLLVPMYDRGGGVIGVIWADVPEDRVLPSAELLQALRVFANQATAALDSAGRFQEMRFLAEHDPLTRLYNRRAFVDALRIEMTRARRYTRPFALVVLDVDGLKEVNDARGHQAGDDALVRTGSVLRAGLRSADTAYRIGGDEFALLLPETTADEARAVVERIADELRATPEADRLAASFGVALWSEAFAEPEALLREADAAMYVAKRSGASVHFAA